jgi:hypothetical protein
MKRYGVVLFFATMACGKFDICQNPDMYLDNGICVTMNGYDEISSNEIEYAINETEKEVFSRYGNSGFPQWRIKYPYKDTEIQFFNNEVYGDNGEESGGATVYYISPTTEDVKFSIELETSNSKCFNLAVIIPHEILHVYLVSVEQDGSHKNGWNRAARQLWTDQTLEEQNSIQSTVTKRIYCSNDFCNPSFYGCEE